MRSSSNDAPNGVNRAWPTMPRLRYITTGLAMLTPSNTDHYHATHLPLVADVPCPEIVARLPDPPPVVLGGQDQSADDVEANAVGLLFILTVALAAGIGSWVVLGALGVRP